MPIYSPRFVRYFLLFGVSGPHCICGKGYHLLHVQCNQCGSNLSKVAISFSNNLFTGFIYGIAVRWVGLGTRQCMVGWLFSLAPPAFPT